MWDSGKEAIAFIETRRHHHSGLDLLVNAMEELGNPQNDLKSIHIGGTNGKGSSVDFIRSVLSEENYSVGTFTSPYLITHHDRIRINNQPISDERLLSYINETEYLWRKYDLSMFEIDMMIACLYFKEEKVDYCVFEVGMGGRLDATNILHPMVVGISNIGMDHMQFLGDSYELIATEKAGIVKEGVDCISQSKIDDCIKVFENICKSKNSHFIQVGDVKHLEDGFIYRNVEYHLQSKAKYQRYNAAFAIEILTYLNEHKYIELTEENIKKGISNTQWLGRFEIVKENPLVIIDGAHNYDGICQLVDSMKIYDNIHIVFSCLKDKEGLKMVQKLFEISNDITVCEFENDRADSIDHFMNLNIHVEKDYHKAIDEAILKKGVTLICGSLYFISIVRKYLVK